MIGAYIEFLWAGDPFSAGDPLRAGDALFVQISTYLALTADFGALDFYDPDLIFLAYYEKFSSEFVIWDPSELFERWDLVTFLELIIFV